MRRLALNPKQLAAEARIKQKPLRDRSRGGFTVPLEVIASRTWPLLRHFQFSIPAALQHPRQHRIAVVLAAGLLASLLIAPVHAQTYPTQYLPTVWQTEQGLPQNSVNALLQDHEGYLWLGTFAGLARFDGERFRVTGLTDTPGLRSLRIISLYESRTRALWIGTAGGGLMRLDHGITTTYTERDGLPSGFINSIRGDAEENVWINTSGGVALFDGAKWQAHATHRGKAVREFYLQARDGSMWFRNGKEVMRFGADGSFAMLNSPEPSVFLVHEARDGTVWIGVRDASIGWCATPRGYSPTYRYRQLGRRELTAWASRVSPHHGAGSDGEVLLFTPAGLVRTFAGTLSPPITLRLPTDGGEVPKPRSLLVDREGNLWVGMIGTGLVRLRPAPLTAYGKDEGLSDGSFNAVFQDREGRIWLGGDNSLYSFDGNRFHLFPGVVSIFAIAQTRNGDLWFGGYGGLYRWRSGVLSISRWKRRPWDRIYQDREGTLWIGGSREDRPGGLYRFREGKLDQIPGISGVQQIIGGPGRWLLGGCHRGALLCARWQSRPVPPEPKSARPHVFGYLPGFDRDSLAGDLRRRDCSVFGTAA